MSEGPDVSFNGSPTVSPVTAALCSKLPLPLTYPCSSINSPLSIYFLVLSQAPPVLLIDIASYTPLKRAPGKRPATNIGWNTTPKNIGVKITNRPGNIISLNEAFVDTSIHLA